MIADSLHAVGLLGIPLCTAVLLLLKHGRAKRSVQSILIRFAPIGLVGILSVLQLRITGQALAEWVSPAVGVLLVGLCVASDRAFRTYSVWMLCCSIVLSLHFSYLAISGFTANPSSSMALQAARERAIVRHAERELAETLSADQSFPPSLLNDILPAPETWRLDTITVHPRWHTWLTRLYRIENVPGELWYTGGPIGKRVDHISVRH